MEKQTFHSQSIHTLLCQQALLDLLHKAKMIDTNNGSSALHDIKGAKKSLKSGSLAQSLLLSGRERHKLNPQRS